MCESDPQRIRVPVDRGTEEALAEVERDRPLLEPPKRRGWDERGEVAQPSHERQDPGDGRDAGVRRAPAAAVAAAPAPETRIATAKQTVAAAAIRKRVRAYPTRCRAARKSSNAAIVSMVKK